MKILHVTDGIQAVDMVRNDRSINLILMDIKLPKLNGFDATRQIKKLRPDIIIIAQTAFAAQNDEKLAMEAGCDDYISKPIDKLLLIEKIAYHVA